MGSISETTTDPIERSQIFTTLTRAIGYVQNAGPVFRPVIDKLFEVKRDILAIELRMKDRDDLAGILDVPARAGTLQAKYSRLFDAQQAYDAEVAVMDAALLKRHAPLNARDRARRELLEALRAEVVAHLGEQLASLICVSENDDDLPF